MKTAIFRISSVIMALILLNTQTFANTYSIASSSKAIEDVANFNEADIYDVFDEVGDLVDYLDHNNNSSYDDVKAVDANLLENVNANSTIALNGSAGGEAPIISAFLWGCIFNIVGVFIVAISTEFDSDEITSSLLGCLVNAVLFGGGISIYIGR